MALFGSNWTDDSNDDIGPFSHWNDDEDLYSTNTNLNKEDVLNLLINFSNKDRNWIINKLSTHEVKNKILNNLKK